MKLSVFRNDDLVTEYEVDEEQTSSNQLDNVIFLGRSDECHLVIDDKQISRQHLKFFKASGEWQFEKLADLGQVLLNGSVVSKGKIKNGDILSFSGYLVNVFSTVSHSAVAAAPIIHQESSAKPAATNSMINEFKKFKEENQDAEIEEAVPVKVSKPKPAPKKVESEEVTEVLPQSDDETAVLQNEGETEVFSTEASDQDSFETTEAVDEFGSSHENDFLSSESEPAQDTFSSQNTEADFQSSSNNDDTSHGAETESIENSNVGESTVVFKGFATYELALFGENIPYDKYVINSNETFIGRNKAKCQIFLDDQEVSGTHAVLKKVNNTLVVEDLNSSNGTIVNGERVNRAQLANGDEFIIGSTTFTLHVKSDLIQEESDYLMPVEEVQEITREEIVEEEVESDQNEAGLDFSDGNAQPASKGLFSKDALKDPAKRKKLIYILVAIFGAYMFLGEEEKPAEPKKSGKPEEQKSSEQGKTDSKRLINPDAKEETKVDPLKPKKKTLSKEQEKEISGYYQQGKAYTQRGEYDKALIEFNRYYDSFPDYENTAQLYQLAKSGMAQLAEADRKIKEEAERQKRKKEVEALLSKAKEAVKERQVMVAEALFGQILEKDPENLDVPQLKMELDAFKKEQERIALEKAQKEAERKRQVDLLQPGKTAYIKKDWYIAILKLEEFLKNKGMDEDLVKEGSTMLTESKANLSDIVSPLLGQARSLKEGQDLKGAYQIYSEVLKKEPTNLEAMNEMNEIKTTLDERAKKLYREALISESLSLFDDAKEKFQEVQQTTPTDSEYYKKASDKLKNYVE